MVQLFKALVEDPGVIGGFLLVPSAQSSDIRGYACGEFIHAGKTHNTGLRRTQRKENTFKLLLSFFHNAGASLPRCLPWGGVWDVSFRLYPATHVSLFCLVFFFSQL